MAQLASDDDNPNFVGAQNPDSRLYVRFFRMAVQNEFRSQVEGRPVFEDLDMVEIIPPGDQLLKVVAPVREDHKRRFPQHWAHFMNTQGGDALQIGTPITQWPLLGPAQVAQLHALKFMTVEQIAEASDMQLQKMGTAGGIAATALRDKAVRYLAVARDASVVDHAKEELDAIKRAQAEKDAEHAQQMAAMREQMDALMKLVSEKRKPGRPAGSTKKKPAEQPQEAA